MNLTECSPFRFCSKQFSTSQLIQELTRGVDVLGFSYILPRGQAFPCETSQVLGHLRNNHTVKVRLGDSTVSAAKQIAEDVTTQLSVELALDSLSVFLSPKGGITPVHYDRAAVFVLQLRGTKRLGVQRIASMPFPPCDCLAEDQSTVMDVWYTMRRGDGVYVPPGHLHTTRTDEFSITLGIGLKLSPEMLATGSRSQRKPAMTPNSPAEKGIFKITEAGEEKAMV